MYDILGSLKNSSVVFDYLVLFYLKEQENIQVAFHDDAAAPNMVLSLTNYTDHVVSASWNMDHQPPLNPVQILSSDVICT